MTERDEMELAPCPFCGGAGIASDASWTSSKAHDVECKDCGASVPIEPTPELAVSHWNTRAASPEPGYVAGLQGNLRGIIGQIRRWLEWDRDYRARENLATDNDTHIMSLPVPFWPSHGQFQNWIKILEECSAALPAPATAGEAHSASEAEVQELAMFLRANDVRRLSWEYEASLLLSTYKITKRSAT